MVHASALGLLVTCAVLSLATAHAFNHLHEWERFKLRHRKQYANLVEEAGRLTVFADNLRRIRQHNTEAAAGKHRFTLAMNHFGDLNGKEFAEYVRRFNSNSSLSRQGKSLKHVASGKAAPASKDWRTVGAVTPVKNQGQCGSCWSFSTTGAIEAAAFLKTGKLVSLSEQNLLDCSRRYGNQGCNGGLMDSAFQYVIDNGGIATEESYPYEEFSDFECRYTSADRGATISKYVDIPSGSETSLVSALADVGPVSVAIDASQFSFQFYSSGVYDEPACSSSRLDHGVLAVGYGQGFWLVKNSWGTRWGEQGYIRMKRDGKNQCGIATSASYPMV